MAATALTKSVAGGGYAAAGVVLTMTAADVANGNKFTASGNDLIVVENTGGAPYTFTITSTADSLGRTGHITAQAIAAGASYIVGPLPLAGWVQTDGTILCSASNAAVKFGIISLLG
jgi:hypothetical protein